MAGILATQMQEWRLKNRSLYENEFRGTACGALEFYVSQNSVPGGPVTPEMRRRAIGSMGNTIKFPVLKRDASTTVSTSRTCSAGNADIESYLQTLSWLVAGTSFRYFPNRYMNNDITADEHFTALMITAARIIREKLDLYCLADLSTNKTQVLKDTLGYTFSGNIVTANGEDRFDILSDIQAMMIANGYSAPLHIIGTPGVLNMYDKLAQHGLYNAVNKRNEFQDKVLHLDGNLSHSGVFAALYAVAEGQVGFIDRVSRAQFNGDKADNYEWATMVMPGIPGVNIGVTRKTITGDMHSYLDNSGADMTCDYGYEYIFEAEIAFVDKYNSALSTYPNPIISATIGNYSRGVNKVQLTGAGTAAATPLYTQDVTPSASPEA